MLRNPTKWPRISSVSSLLFFGLLLVALIGLPLAGCGTPQPESRTAADRRAEAKRLRGGVPAAVEPDHPTDSGQGEKEAIKKDDDGEKIAKVDSKKKKKKKKAAKKKKKKKSDGAEDGEAPSLEVVLPPPFELEEMLEPLPGAGPEEDLVLGVFSLKKKKPILDGDTIKVEGLDSSLRLLGIDSEETFKKEENRKASDFDFKSYAKDKRGDKRFPAKYGTPLGMEAWDWAIDYFAGHTEVRLEYDEIGRQKGVFGRYLVYVFAKKNGEWENYNVEHVRAGMAPYFMKYGYSRRFHAEFVQAQEEARANKVGIWGNGNHYPDYEERLIWWIRRANQIVRFERDHANDPTYFQLGLDSEWDRMEDYVGETVTVFGTFGDLKAEKSPYLLGVSHKRFKDFTIVAWEMGDIEALQHEEFDGEYVYVQGKLSKYKDKYQFKATNVYKIWTE